MSRVYGGRRRSKKYDVIAQMIRDAGSGAAGIITAKKQKQAAEQEAKAQAFDDERAQMEKLRKGVFDPAQKVVTKGKAEYGQIEPPKFPKMSEAMMKRLLPEEENPVKPSELRAQERHDYWKAHRDDPKAAAKPDASAQDLQAILGNPEMLVPIVTEANEWAGTSGHITKLHELMKASGINDPELRDGILSKILDPDVWSSLGGKGNPPQRMAGIGGDPVSDLDATLKRLEAELASPE